MSLRHGRSVVAAIGFVFAVVQIARAAEPVILTGGFTDHLQRTQGGRIDWTNGYVLAEGIGHPNGSEESEEQAWKMAERGAELIAARNALAIAKGIRLDASGTLGSIQNGTVRLEGVIRGHKIVESQWNPNVKPPQCRVVLRVPLWGVRGVATTFASVGRLHALQGAGRRLVLTSRTADAAEVVVVLDARGVKLSQCLYPVVLDTAGNILYDVTVISQEYQKDAPAVRYVETDLSFEKLQAGLQFVPVWRDVLVQDTSGVQVTPSSGSSSESRPSASQPAKRRAKQRIVVKVKEAGGAARTQLILTREDAQRLRESPEAAGAMKNAQVLIVVDAAAAGTEGCAPIADERIFALVGALRVDE